jgi:hypothetical protein
MANPEHLEILRQSVEAWNKWRAERSEVIPNLSEANLAEVNFGGADFSGADLRGTNLSGTDVSGADLLNAER